jgi:hypothetical protein
MLLAAMLLVALAGCGSSSTSTITTKSANEIAAASQAAANGAASAHVAGAIVSGGSPITLNMDLLSGGGGRGSVSENGRGFELIRNGNTIYINGSKAFYESAAGAAAANRLAGKWIKAPADSGDFSSLASLTDLHSLVNQVFSSHGTLAKGPVTTVGGKSAVALIDRTKGGTLYVATTGLPYPLQIIGSKSNAGKVTFDRWNEPVSLAPPPGAIDVEKLRSGG